ncbi:histidinol dehydrogenase [Cloacibacillus evryensis]|uniref:histidinol dehydrogenase n=1 Tax=Cloacibacillus evryensis TaxID=508460 RepID=UPI0004AE3877|nr:histidinol dehydrogenase [Cloacibacillus evryensis]MEA5036471.1 histidinol dehydrogenase [Cloacibacillus evryensis]
MRYYKETKATNFSQDSRVFTAVKEIVEHVRAEGDAAVSDYNVKFGGQAASSFLVPQSELDRAYDETSPELRAAIERAAANIRKFAELQRDSLWPLGEVEVEEGVFLGHSVIPVDSCCCYVPGGNHPLFSTALMLVIPAKTAGVPRVCAAVPPMRGSALPHPATLAALKAAGADEVYAVGGAQAIAAFAYGTQTIAPVAMIVGPGNKYVTEAKRQVYGKVGIDFIAGPSEVLVIADENASPAVVAADILAQSEHDYDAAGILVTTSEKFARETAAEVLRQLAELDTAEIAAKSWDDNGRIIIADSLTEAAEIANMIAPEHLEINVKEPFALMGSLRNYGSLFIGEGSAEVFGDYVAGTNHTLPTMGAARYTGGLSVMNFLKVCTFQHITPQGAAKLAPAAETMATAEGLTAHAKAAAARMKRR